MTDCLGIELPDDNRIISAIEILEKYSIDYLRLHLHSIVSTFVCNGFWSAFSHRFEYLVVCSYCFCS